MKNIVVGSEDCPIFEVIKTLKSLPSFLHLRDKWSEFAYLLGTPSHDVNDLRNDMLVNKIKLHDCLYLILEKWQGRFGDVATLENLAEALEGMEIKDCREPLSSIPFAKYLSKTSFNWSELSPLVQEYIVSNASHQTGVEFNLESHLHLFSTLNCSTLKQLIKEEAMFFRESLPKDISYYVLRRVAPRNIISNDIFSEKSGKDIFLFSKLDMPELYVMAGKETIGYSRNNLDYPRARFIVLNEPAHFDMICKRTKENVHLLEKEGSLLKWRKSRGKIKVLQKCQAEAQDNLRQGAFKYIGGDLPVIISDTAGMGKSTLLAKIGWILRESNPAVHVSFIIFPDFVRQIKDVPGQETLKHKIEIALQNSLCSNNLEREVLTLKLAEDKKRFELLLDGFDEINSDDNRLGFDILSTISSFKSVRIWVTSRPQHLHRLEDTLNVLGFNILPFNKEDQIQFFVGYWSRSSRMDNITKLTNFSKLCLDTLNARLSDKDKEITGIPLQCLMIGEVFEDYVGLEDAEASLKSSIYSITDLYQHFIECKFKKFEKIYSPTNIQKKLLVKLHDKLSFELLFENSENVKQLFGRAHTSFKDILNVGIVEDWSGADQTPKFIHRSFAEYFIALFLVQKFSCDEDEGKFWSEGMINFFFRKVFQTYTKFKFSADMNSDHKKLNYQRFRHSVVCHFLNSFLVGIKDSLLIKLKINTVWEKLSSKNISIVKICYAAVNHNYWGLFLFLDRLNAFDEIERETFTESFLNFSIEHGGIEIFERVLRHFENNYEFSDQIKIGVLKKALMKGDFLIVQFLLKKKGLDELSKTLNLPLLNYVVQHSWNNNSIILQQKKCIMNVLYQQNSSILELVDEGGRTPLVSDFVHVELLHELVKLGANFLAKNLDGNTVLHVRTLSSMVGRNSNQLQKLLETMQKVNEPNLRKLFQSIGAKRELKIAESAPKDPFQISQCGEMKPFRSIISALNPLKKTIQLAINMGVNLNELDSHGYSCLAVAIYRERSIETILALLKFGADANWKHKHTLQTPVHIAALVCNWHIFAVLLDNYKLGLNEVDSKQNSPLDIVAHKIQLNQSWQDMKQPEAVDFAIELIRRGASGKRVSMTSILHNAIAFGKEESVKWLIISKNVDVRRSMWTHMKTLWKRSLNTQSCTSWGNDRDYFAKVFSYLFEANVDLEAEGLEKKTLLHVFVSKYMEWNPELLHSFVETLRKFNLCHLLNKRDIKERTPIHLAIRIVEISVKTLDLLNNVGYDWDAAPYGHANLLYEAIVWEKCMDVVKSLIAFGADLNNVNRSGNGLIHACCTTFNVKAMQYLLGFGNFGVNLKNKNGITPLHMVLLAHSAFEKLIMEIIVTLLKNGAEYSNILGHDLETVIDLSNPDVERLRIIVEQAATRLKIEKRQGQAL